MSEGNNGIFSFVFDAVIAGIFLLAVFHFSQYIPFVVNLFVYYIVDSVQGMIVAAFLSAITFGALSKLEGRISVSVLVFSISLGTIAVILIEYYVQSVLFH